MRELVSDAGAALHAMRPGRFPYLRFMGALALAGAGGYLFHSLALPLPWMLGALTFCTLGALIKAPIAAPGIVRPPMTMVIGVLLGAGFTPQVIAQLPGWIPTVLGLAAFVALSGVACIFYFRRVAGFDPTTAYFAGMPGGLIEMVVLGEERGGDARIIALIHSARILLIVLTLPFIVQMIEGVQLGASAPFGVSVFDAPLSTALWLIATAALGAVLGHLLRLPAKFLLGPMLLSAAIHMSDLSDFKPPFEIVNGAQLVLGATIGCRFLGTPAREILRILVLSLGSTVILLSFTLLFGAIVSRFSDYGSTPIILAYSPGGLTEMSLVALALHVEVAFVAAHHIIRIFFVMTAAAPIFALMARRRADRE